MQRAWRIAAALFAALFALWAQQSWQLSLRDTLGPGPGFFPFCLSLGGLALSIALIVRPPLFGPAAAGDETPLVPRGNAAYRVAMVVVCLIAATALLDVFGYRLAMAAFCIVLLRAIGTRTWWIILVFAAAASIGVDAVFSDMLKVPLPRGVFGF